MPLAIKAENLSKAYQLGQIGTGTISRDVERWLARVRGKEDPFLRIGEINDRTTKGISDVVWSLKDINFEIEEGDAVGIIGRNGAGKSTLLKILSRVTSPTTGGFKVKGRIASLLEVGTGFHPELSGRENIYLNGAILGMRRKEIRRKFDEIVDFAGVERYIDTPVKRYSSGMYVRLAFAVAAHLDSEILIIDEVLAVGDVEFQKKCLGKMNEVSKREGRTILFVSHNMTAIQHLCKTAVLLSEGVLKKIGKTQEIIIYYLKDRKREDTRLSDVKDRKGNGFMKFVDGFVEDVKKNSRENVEAFSDINIELDFILKSSQADIKSCRIDIGINNQLGDRVAWLSSDNINGEINFLKRKVVFKIWCLPLAPGEYNCNLYCEINNEVSDWLNNVLNFSIIEKDYYGTGRSLPASQGHVLLDYSLE